MSKIRLFQIIIAVVIFVGAGIIYFGAGGIQSPIGQNSDLSNKIASETPKESTIIQTPWVIKNEFFLYYKEGVVYKIGLDGKIAKEIFLKSFFNGASSFFSNLSLAENGNTLLVEKITGLEDTPSGPITRDDSRVTVYTVNLTNGTIKELFTTKESIEGFSYEDRFAHHISPNGKKILRISRIDKGLELYDIESAQHKKINVEPSDGRAIFSYRGVSLFEKWWFGGWPGEWLGDSTNVYFKSDEIVALASQYYIFNIDSRELKVIFESDKTCGKGTLIEAWLFKTDTNLGFITCSEDETKLSRFSGDVVKLINRMTGEEVTIFQNSDFPEDEQIVAIRWLPNTVPLDNSKFIYPDPKNRSMMLFNIKNSSVTPLPIPYETHMRNYWISPSGKYLVYDTYSGEKNVSELKLYNFFNNDVRVIIPEKSDLQPLGWIWN